MTVTAALGYVLYDCYIEKLSEPQILVIYMSALVFMFNKLESDRDEMCECPTADFIKRDKLYQCGKLP